VLFLKFDGLVAAIVSHLLPRQAKQLRSLDATIPFELEQVRGGYLHTERLSLQGLLFAKGYSQCGIEMDWAPMTIKANSARMAVSDDFSEMLAEVSFAIIEQHARRNLTFSHGLPRRQVCLLAPGLAPGFISQLKKDVEIHAQIKELSFDGVESYLQRSVFNHMAVRQLIGCLQEDNWEATPRTASGAELAE
jgi:hypothetical protein